MRFCCLFQALFIRSMFMDPRWECRFCKQMEAVAVEYGALTFSGKDQPAEILIVREGVKMREHLNILYKYIYGETL